MRCKQCVDWWRRGKDADGRKLARHMGTCIYSTRPQSDQPKRFRQPFYLTTADSRCVWWTERTSEGAKCNKVAKFNNFFDLDEVGEEVEW